MGRIVQWAKDHPKLSIALGIGLLILIYLYSRRSASSSSAATVGTTGLSEQGYLSLNASELAASTQLQGQQVAAGVATSQLTDQLQAQQSNYATQLSIAQLQADTQNKTVYAQSQLGIDQITAQEQVSLATIQANQQTASDQLALDQALIGLATGTGRNVVLNPSPTTPVSPVITSSAPNQPTMAGSQGYNPAYAPQAINPTAPNSAPAPNYTTVSSVPYTSVVTLPGTAPSGVSEIPGVNYFAPGPQPFQPDYTFPSQEAAVAAGAGTVNPVTGRFIPNPGLQVTY